MPAKKRGRPSSGKPGLGPVMPAFEFRSPLLGPDPAPSEEVLFDLGQLTASGAYASLDDLNSHLARLTAAGPIPRSKPAEPRAQAQRLVYDAWRTSNEAGAPLARKALALDPDCADAHLFLAVASGNPEEVLKHAFAALETGERWLEREKETVPDEGHLWTYLPARPYLRARVFLARGLWAMGGRVAAVSLLQETLRLDQGDALGARYLLLAWYLEMGEEMLSRDLLAQYNQERSTILLYGDALLTFWERGEETTTNNRLKRALKANPHVPERLLLPLDPLKVLAIDSYRPGSEEEADLCAFLLGPGWERDVEAMEWLEEAASRGPTHRSDA